MLAVLQVNGNNTNMEKNSTNVIKKLWKKSKNYIEKTMAVCYVKGNKGEFGNYPHKKDPLLSHEVL